MSENRDADRLPLELWFRILCDARAAGNLNARHLHCAEELYRAALTAQQGLAVEAAADRDLHAEVERLRRELRAARHHAETNRDVAAVLGYEAGQREAEQRGRAGAEEAWRRWIAGEWVAAAQVDPRGNGHVPWEGLTQQEAAERGFHAGRAAAQAEGELREQVAVIEDRREQAAKHHEIIKRWEKSAEGFRERATTAEAEAAQLRDTLREFLREGDDVLGFPPMDDSPEGGLIYVLWNRLAVLASDSAREA